MKKAIKRLFILMIIFAAATSLSYATTESTYRALVAEASALIGTAGYENHDDATIGMYSAASLTNLNALTPNQSELDAMSDEDFTEEKNTELAVAIENVKKTLVHIEGILPGEPFRIHTYKAITSFEDVGYLSGVDSGHAFYSLYDANRSEQTWIYLSTADGTVQIKNEANHKYIARVHDIFLEMTTIPSAWTITKDASHDYYYLSTEDIEHSYLTCTVATGKIDFWSTEQADIESGGEKSSQFILIRAAEHDLALENEYKALIQKARPMLLYASYVNSDDANIGEYAVSAINVLNALVPTEEEVNVKNQFSSQENLHLISAMNTVDESKIYIDGILPNMPFIIRSHENMTPLNASGYLTGAEIGKASIEAHDTDYEDYQTYLYIPTEGGKFIIKCYDAEKNITRYQNNFVAMTESNATWTLEKDATTGGYYMHIEEPSAGYLTAKKANNTTSFYDSKNWNSRIYDGIWILEKALHYNDFYEFKYKKLIDKARPLLKNLSYTSHNDANIGEYSAARISALSALVPSEAEVDAKIKFTESEIHLLYEAIHAVENSKCYIEGILPGEHFLIHTYTDVSDAGADYLTSAGLELSAVLSIYTADENLQTWSYSIIKEDSVSIQCVQNQNYLSRNVSSVLNMTNDASGWSITKDLSNNWYYLHTQVYTPGYAAADVSTGGLEFYDRIDCDSRSKGAKTNRFILEAANYYSVTAIANFSSRGTVAISNAQPVRDESVTLTATANSGYQFSFWHNSSGEAISVENPYTFSVNNPINHFIAHFVNEKGDTLELYEEAWNQESVNTLSHISNPSEIVKLDFEKATFEVENLSLPITLNPNCLVHTPTGNYFGKNDINPHTYNCRNMLLEDKHPFSAPTQIMVETGSYVRDWGTNVSGWYTIYLPFALSTDDISNIGFTAVEEYVGLNDAGTALIFNSVTTTEANKPYIVTFDNEGVDPSSTTEMPLNGKVIKTKKSNDSSAFKGTYANLLPGEVTGKYILNVAGTAFQRASNLARVSAFRAYLDLGPSYSLKMRVLHNGETGLELISQNKLIISGDKSSIHIKSDDARVVKLYSITGMLLKILNLTIGETTINNLSKGIYIIEKQKVTVK